MVRSQIIAQEITGHPDSVAIRKQQIETRVADLRFIIDQLERIQSGALRHPLNGYLDLIGSA